MPRHIECKKRTPLLHICKKSINFKVLKIKLILSVLMDKFNTLFPELQTSETEKSFSIKKTGCGKKIRIDFDAPDLSSKGGLVLLEGIDTSFLDKIADVIPDWRNQYLILHPMREMVRQRVGQIACGYEDANDCDTLRCDSAVKIFSGRKPSDDELSSQPTMTRLENHISKQTLFDIADVFIDHFIASYAKPPKKIILDVDDTNSNTYGEQQLTLFNDYYGEYCYMPLLIYEGYSGRTILPLLRPGRTNKSLNVFGIFKRLVERVHKAWPGCHILLRGDSHFCSHEFMDWASDSQPFVGFITGISSNPILMKKIDKPLHRWRRAFEKDRKPMCHYYSFTYRAQSWKHEQRVVAKIEFTRMGENIRFIVTSNRNNTPETLYRRYCGRGKMELWIKDFKVLRGDRMSCGSYRANYFRLFLYAAAQVLLYDFKHTAFNDTEVESFTIDRFIKRIMLSAVMIKEQKCAIRVHLVSHHRHRSQIEAFLRSVA